MLSGPLGVLLVPAVWLAGFVAFRRYRRRTRGFADNATFKSRLPQWVKQLEFYSFAVALSAYVTLSFIGLFRLHRALHPQTPPTDLATTMIAVACIFPAITLAMLTSNLISWAIPPARNANLAAMSGLDKVSFGSLNRGLLLFALVIVPICMVQGLVGAFEPWAG
jgi:hypothetical protein